MVVNKICASCEFSCFKKDCPRGTWNSKDYSEHTIKFGHDAECPLMQFKTRKPSQKEKNLFGGYDITIGQTWEVCKQCKYSEVKHGTISIDNAFKNHCMDCTCNQIRENLEEMRAEALMS